MKEMASSVKIEVADNLTRGNHILHEQEYHTRHGISAIFHEICRKIRRQPCYPEIQQEPVVYLLLEGALGWNGTISVLSVPSGTQPSQAAYRERMEADPGYMPP